MMSSTVASSLTRLALLFWTLGILQFVRITQRVEPRKKNPSTNGFGDTVTGYGCFSSCPCSKESRGQDRGQQGRGRSGPVEYVAPKMLAAPPPPKRVPVRQMRATPGGHWMLQCQMLLLFSRWLSKRFLQPCRLVGCDGCAPALTGNGKGNAYDGWSGASCKGNAYSGWNGVLAAGMPRGPASSTEGVPGNTRLLLPTM